MILFSKERNTRSGFDTRYLHFKVLRAATTSIIFSDQRHCQQYTCTANQLLYKLWSLNSAKNQYSFTDNCVAVDGIVSRQTTLINKWYVTLLQRHSTWNERASTWLYSKQLVAWLYGRKLYGIMYTKNHKSFVLIRIEPQKSLRSNKQISKCCFNEHSSKEKKLKVVVWLKS